MKSEKSLLVPAPTQVWETQFSIEGVNLEGDLTIPEEALGLVIFVNGTHSGRFSPRNRFMAQMLHKARFGTLLFDLFTPEEEKLDLQSSQLRYDIALMGQRLVEVTEEMFHADQTSQLRCAYFGSSTGGGAALMAAARLGSGICGVISRSGRPDLAGAALHDVTAPTLLIVGGLDRSGLQLNEEAYNKLRCPKEIQLIPAASNLLEEPGALEAAGEVATNWLLHQFTSDNNSGVHNPRPTLPHFLK